MSVLYVEDDADLREVMALWLERCGAVVQQATTAEEALALFLDSPPSVVLSDIAMPGKDGLWLLNQVRARTGSASVPFIAFTGRTRAPDRAEVLAAGFIEYLVKPTEQDVVVGAILKAVASPRLPRSA